MADRDPNKPERPWVKWYKTKEWHRLRYWQLKKQPLCVFCKKHGIIKEANTVDHKKPHKGNMALFLNRDNLQSLCKECHSSTKQRLEKSGEFGCDERGFVPGWK